MNAKELKRQLQALKENDFQTKDPSEVEALLPHMLENIGNKDMVLRDNLIYTCLYFWIIKYNYIGTEVLIKILQMVMGENHLFYKISTADDGAIYKRTFSVLVVALILYRHQQDNILEQETYIGVKDSLLRYYQEEKDLRGFDFNFGWAHGIAHCADAFDELVACKECDDDINKEVLKAIKEVMYSENNIYNHGEGDRIAQVIHTIISKKHTSVIDIEHWLVNLATLDNEGPLKLASNFGKFATRENIRALLRAIYFRGLKENYDKSLLDLIFKVEGDL